MTTPATRLAPLRRGSLLSLDSALLRGPTMAACTSCPHQATKATPCALWPVHDDQGWRAVSELRVLVIGLGIVDLAVGLVAAYYWYKSSTIPFPTQPLTPDPRDPALGDRVRTNYALEVHDKLHEVARLRKIAAI